MNTDKSFDSGQLLALLALSKDATAIYSDAELTIAFVNNAMLYIWGKDASVTGMRFEDALPEMKDQPFTGLLKEVWHSGKRYEARDTRADIVVDGKLQSFWFNFVYEPIPDASGKTYAIFHTATNVEARMAAEKQAVESFGQILLRPGAWFVYLCRDHPPAWW